MNRTLTTLLAASLLAAPAAAEEKAGGKPKAEARAAARETYAVFVTSRGKIAARLLPDETPNAVKNFVELATGKKEWTDPKTKGPTRESLYDGTLFHRVIPSFMIQGGDPMSRGAPVLSGAPVQADNRFGFYGPGVRLDDELKPGSKPFDEPCQLAFANSGPDTSGSQFFITEVPYPSLNPQPCPTCKLKVKGYVRFGVVVCGCDKVRPIALAGGSQTRLEKVLIVHEKPSCE
jgi:peptidyl-prolyl cis-trans isomerase A (cyclophilin A)